MIALVYSLAGSVLCLSGMVFCRRIVDERHLWLASVCGAILHNIGQLLVAILIIGIGVVVYLPFLLVAGCLAGAFADYCAQLMINRLRSGQTSAGMYCQ